MSTKHSLRRLGPEFAFVERGGRHLACRRAGHPARRNWCLVREGACELMSEAGRQDAALYGSQDGRRSAPGRFFGDIVKDCVMFRPQTQSDMKDRRRFSAFRHTRLNRIYALARERYVALGVDVDRALRTLAGIPISLHCWQGDDVCGFEKRRTPLGGGLAVTGNYPGKARTPDELRADIELALSLIPGKHRVNLHAIYGEFGGPRVDRNEIDAGHFRNWIGWAKGNGLGLDFNATCFAHPKSADGFTLSHSDRVIRRFWIEHCIRSREIGAAMGRALGTPCVTNLWIPDGFKDTPADRKAPRQRLAASLDVVFKQPFPAKHNLDSVEPKLFGIGAESCTVGSYEFYLGYAITRRKMLCLDAGHFHPTETIADKISSVLEFLPEILLHVSRGVRWDSDHVVTFTDDLQAIAREIVANDYLERVHLGLDYFD